MVESKSVTSPNTKNRPLSPHLTIYKPQITSVLSISHRITGMFLACGLAFLVLTLWFAAYSPSCYTTIVEYAGTWWGIGLLMAWTLAFFYHFLNGMRHLFWDAGHGFELDVVTRSGGIVLVGTPVLTFLVWYMLLLG